MRSLHLTLLIFIQVLLAATLLYSANFLAGEASPLTGSAAPIVAHQAPSSPAVVPVVEQPQVKPQQVAVQPHHAPAAPTQQVVADSPVVVKPHAAAVAAHHEHQEVAMVAKSAAVQPPMEAAENKPGKMEPMTSGKLVMKPVAEPMMVEAKSLAPPAKEASVVELRPFPGQVEKTAPYYEIEKQQQNKVSSTNKSVHASLTVQSPEPRLLVVGGRSKEEQRQQEPAPVQPPVVNGGLGPLHLLAATLCSQQPDKPVADETLNHLYNQRAAVRKSLFDFMSLKFTSLEKFSSRLNSGLEIMPRRPVASQGDQQPPSHGWPVVGKCTAHDLRLMAEAAWCEAPASSNPSRVGGARALADDDQQAVISKILHVSHADLAREAPNVERTIASMNLTQQQLAELQAQASSTRLCRRNALRLTKSLLNHLAEDQKQVSESWPQLQAQMAEDDCARRRMVDIVNALASFRSDSTGTIRRDNVEFAFAMDDLRSKVLESEVNVPLTFDKQFIEVEQFLQQSVKLMLSNIDPERAKLTSMRYRSLLASPVASPVAAVSSNEDQQCVELHQRLLAKSHPTDCNPTQFGQLPDVLRMAASSLELWSIESELSKRPQQDQQQQQPNNNKREVNECIANLVAS